MYRYSEYDPADVANLLECAADHIEKVGMTKGTYFKGLDFTDLNMEQIRQLAQTDYKDAPCCAYGALYSCSPSENLVQVAATNVSLGLRNEPELDEWNDSPSRRKGDVVRAFRKTAAQLREGKNETN